LKFYKTLVIPTLLYGSETWTLTASQLKRLEAAEMQLLRPLAGHTLLDHKQNEDIRKKLNIENITSIICSTNHQEEGTSDDHKNVGRSSYD
jgi:hypothetical protein